MLRPLLLVALILAACGAEASPPDPIPAPATSLTTKPTVTARQTLGPESLDNLKAFLLELINADRASVGLSPVVLGSNLAAQGQAEEMLEHSYVSHWGLDGIPPYMRYTLAGGMNYESENTSGVAETPETESLYRTISPKEKLREIEGDWMQSPGHRTNILFPWHKKVNLGIACNRITCQAVQQLKGNYIEFQRPPTLSSGMLSVAFQLSVEFELSGIQVGTINRRTQ